MSLKRSLVLAAALTLSGQALASDPMRWRLAQRVAASPGSNTSCDCYDDAADI